MSPLVLPGVQTLSGSGDAGESSQAPSGGSSGVRERSATAYEGLSSQAAESKLGELDPGVVGVSTGGPPPLAEGQKAIGYPSDYAMSVELGGEAGGVRHALVESAVPMALETGNGVHTPLDLGLREAGGGFEPSFGLTPVRLPLHLGEGAEATNTEVSLTPVTEQGSVLEGSGVIDHAGVFYGGTEDATAGSQDLSMFAKPTVGGFEFFSVLFSERSPGDLYFRVGLPHGATLEELRPTEVRVESSGQTLATIGAPDAHDAEGALVPISMSVVSSDTLKIDVPRKAGQFEYPLTVDPEYTDGTFLPYLNPAWKLNLSEGGSFKLGEYGGGSLDLVDDGPIKNKEWGAYQYQTQGKSKIYKLEAETKERDYFTETETLLEAYAPNGTQENWGLLADNTETAKFSAAICAIKTESCLPSQGANNNMVEWVKRVLTEGAGGFEDELYRADVWISQEEAPTVHFNTESPKIAIKEPDGTVVERENILYPGSKGWIGPFSSTAFEMIAGDPGVGVSLAAADGGTGGKLWSRETFLMSTEKDCQGVQCPEEFKGKYTYFTNTPGFTSQLPSGEYSIQGRAEDALKLTEETHVTVRVDATPPENIKLVNLPAGGQIGEGIYKIKAEATDGKTGEPSSGVRSLKLGMDGAEAGESKGSCPAGPCTATAEWTVNGGQLSTGPHILTVVATDNAGNEESEDFVIYVHHASPMGVGPGSLDPQSGNYSLGASDVSMGSGLSVTRSYSSRNLTAGVEGPFGPQWTVSLGSNESLEELPDGSMVLTAASGQETVFARNSKGELESPKGDANLALTMEEEKVQKIPAAYYLKNAATGTTTKFARPEGFLQSTPTYYGQDGWQGSVSGQLNVPTGVATDTKSDVWVADTKNDRIDEYNAQGEYVKSFGYEGTGGGAFREPHDVAVDSKGHVWVTDTANNRLEEFTEAGEYVRQAGTTGSGVLKSPQGIAVDSSGNVWVADTGDNRVVEFNENGEYQREASKTVGLKALSEPLGVAVDKSGDVWVTDAKNYRVVEFSSTGSSLKEFGSKGKESGKFEAPTGVAVDSEGNIWVSDTTEDRVQEFNSKDEYLTQFGSAGSNGGQLKKPYFIAVDARGDLAVADSENSRVGRWEHATWVPTNSEGSAPTSKVTYTYKTVLVKGVGTVTRPVKEVAAHLSELSCEPTIKEGCHALIFKYAEKTTATESEWKEYAGRLTEVLFAAYNPATKAVEEKAVAQYVYDAKGRLRAEWDPRISPALTTVYGYDAEGHVTAVSPAGQEPWLLRYGTIPTDASPGRLLSATRPAAATELGSRLAPQNTGLPTLSTSTPAVGSKISVSSNGSWSNTPLAYGYQWEDCKATGECSLIPGAVNESYYPTTSDEKHKLVVVVTAFNAGGATTATTAETGSVAAGTPYSPAPEPPNPGTSAVTTIEYTVPLLGTGLQNLTAGEVEKGWGQKDNPVEGTAVFPPDKPMGWPAKEYTTATISYFDAEGHTVNTVNASGGVSTSEYSPTNNVIRRLSVDDRALALKEGSKSAEVAKQLDDESVYNEEGDELLETLGPEHKIKLANGSEVEARHRVKYMYDQGAPKGTNYRLVTETVDSAVVGGKEEERRITQTHYFGQKGLGWTLRKPTSVTVDPYGLKLTTTTIYNPITGAVVETGTAKGIQEKDLTEEPNYETSFGSYGTGSGQLREAADLTTDSSGNVWVADSQNHNVEEFNSKGEFVRSIGSQGTGNGQFEESVMSVAVSKGDVWATDSSANRVEEFTTEGTFVRAFGSYGTGNGQFYVPEGMAVNSSGDLFVADRGNNRVEEFDPEGKYLKSITKIGNIEELEGPSGLALDAKGNIWVSLTSEQKLEEFSPEGTLLRSFGTAGSAPGQMMYPERFTIGPETNIWVSEYGNSRVQVFSNTGEYLYGFGSSGESEGQFQHPRGISIYGTSVYVLDSAPWDWNTVHQRIEKWTLKSESENGENNAHDEQMIYYTAEANSQYPECGGHVYWEGMPCKTRPASQPEGSSAPALPETTVKAYNMWGEPETTEEAFGTTTRTKKTVYDEAGRVSSTEETSTADTALPKVTNTYNETTGQLVEQATTVGEEKQTVKSVYDRLGRLTSYTDADKNTTNYEYETSGDGRLTGVSDPKGSQTYAYDPTTGELTKLVDSSAKTFTASYDVEGNMTSETYPNGMSATYIHDPTGETTSLEYVKTTHCTEKCTWFSETTVPSIHGETLARSSTLASETYTYDTAGRLTQTTETPAEKGCVTRIYAYDEDSDRTSLTTREPATGGKCATEGGTTETHTYDSGDRLTDTGVSYEPLGNITKLPAADAGGHELASEYYTDGQVQKQTQNGQTNIYSIDPTGRVRKTIAEGTIKQTTIDHYGGPGEALTWKEEGSGKYTRLIPGIDGTLSATETNSGTPVLQLHDLQGNIVATAALAETETKLLSTYNSTEYGVPVNGTPPTKYSWLGSGAVSSELSSGVLIMGTVSYVPQLGRPLQTQSVIPPGMAVNGAEGTPYIAQVSAWSITANNATGQRDSEEYEAALAAQKEAEEKACVIGSICQAPGENFAPNEDEEGEEEFPDPEKKNHGEYGHLFIHYEDIKCNEYDCSSVFTVKATLTDRGKNSTGMQFKISEYIPDVGWQPYLEEPAVEDNGSTPTYNIGEIVMPFGYAYIFELEVRVGKHKETLRTEFFSIHGEGVV
jgi:YD repeat-containing protein